MYNYTWAPWGERRALVDKVLADIELPKPKAKAAE